MDLRVVYETARQRLHDRKQRVVVKVEQVYHVRQEVEAHPVTGAVAAPWGEGLRGETRGSRGTRIYAPKRKSVHNTQHKIEPEISKRLGRAV